MSGDWSFASTNYLSYSPGDFAGSGAFTIAFLMEPDNTGVRLGSWYATAAEQGCLLSDTGDLYGADDFSSGYPAGIDATDSWMLVALSKPAGNQHYRCHVWTYASDGSGTMSHGEAVGAGNHGNFSAATAVRVGWAAGAGNDGMIAVAAFWDRVVSDSEMDTLKSPNLSTWAALSPDLGVHLGSWNGSTGDVVFAGSSGTGTLTGSIGSGANPTSFNFSLSAATKAPPLVPPARRLQPILAR